MYYNKSTLLAFLALGRDPLRRLPPELFFLETWLFFEERRFDVLRALEPRAREAMRVLRAARERMFFLEERRFLVVRGFLLATML